MSDWPIYVISMRPHFWARLSERAQQLRLFPTCWAATDGKTIDVHEWERLGHFAPSTDPKARPMTRGEIGCSDSHQRVWAHVASVGFEGALILEDDVELPAALPEWLERAREHRHLWDVLYLGYIPWAPKVPAGAPGFDIPDIADQWHGAYAYMVTREGARKLLEQARPISMPVDVYMARRTLSGVRVWQSENPVASTFQPDTFSSSQGIR